MSDDVHHPVFARLYPRVDATLAGLGGTDNRAELLRGATGRLLEIGAGHGVNFAYYPRTVTRAIAIEPEPRLRELARQAALRAPVPVEVHAGRAESLRQIEDGSIDVAVTSLVLCSVSSPREVLRELYRVIRPGGELRFYEHIRGTSRGKIRVQRAADLIWPHVAGGCHVSRPTDRWIEDAGFRIQHERHFRFPEAARANPASPHVIGIAVRSA